MSPEQVQAAAVDGRSDQYSLAVVACELLSGVKPFVADTITALAYRIVHEEPRLEAVAAVVGRAAISVLRKALSKDPERRYGSCSEFVEALAAALERPAVAVSPLPSRRLPSWALSGAAAVVLIAVGSGGVKLWTDLRSKDGSSSPPASQAAAAGAGSDSPSLPPTAPLAVSKPAAEPIRSTSKAVATAAQPTVRPAKAAAMPPPTARAVSLRAPEPEPSRTQTPTPQAPSPPPGAEATSPEPSGAQAPVPPLGVEATASRPSGAQVPAPQTPASQPSAPTSPERTPPVLLFQVPPEYTEAARREGRQGEVLLAVEVDERGSPASIQIVRSLEVGLDQKAVEAVRKWRFRPALIGAQAVREVVEVKVRFHLANAPSPHGPSLKRQTKPRN